MFNTVYFAVVSIKFKALEGQNNGERRSAVILSCLLIRNLLTFYAQSLRTLYDAKYSDDGAVHGSDDRVHKKLGLLDLDVIMKNTVPFNKFR